MPNLSAYTSHLSLLPLLNCIFPENAKLQLNLTPEIWQVSTIPYAATLSQLPIHCLRNCFLLSLLDFLLHIFDYVAWESSDSEWVKSIDSSVSDFYSDDYTYFSFQHFPFLLFLVLRNFKSFTTQQALHSVKKTAENKRFPTASYKGTQALTLLEPAGVGH